MTSSCVLFGDVFTVAELFAPFCWCHNEMHKNFNLYIAHLLLPDLSKIYTYILITYVLIIGSNEITLLHHHFTLVLQHIRSPDTYKKIPHYTDNILWELGLPFWKWGGLTIATSPKRGVLCQYILKLTSVRRYAAMRKRSVRTRFKTCLSPTQARLRTHARLRIQVALAQIGCSGTHGYFLPWFSKSFPFIFPFTNFEQYFLNGIICDMFIDLCDIW